MDRVIRLGRDIGDFSRLLFSRFVEDQGLPQAASLTYATLLSLVPLMTVSLAIFSAFPISDKVEMAVQNFVFENFMPTSGEVLQEYLQQFSAKASRLSGTGFAFLIVVALLLMANIDKALNIIWRVKRKRRFVSKFIVYWSILSLGPLLIGVSMVVTSYLVSIPIFSDAADTLSVLQRMLKITPVLASAVAFTLLYAVVPNRRVPIRQAMYGGLFAAVLFELAKRGFAFYLTHFPTYEAIYGALAAFPIFLVWVYLSWIVTLLGAEFSCCLGIYREGRESGERGGRNDLLLAFRILGRLWQAQRKGETLSILALSKVLGRVSVEHLEVLLLELQGAQLVLRTEEHTWALARDLSEVELLELYRVRPFPLPDLDAVTLNDPADRLLAQTLQQMEAGLEGSLAVPLTDYFGNLAPVTPTQDTALDS
jgi:membrane protein